MVQFYLSSHPFGLFPIKQAKKIAVTERITANCFFSESYCITTRKAGPGEFGFGVNTLLI